MTGINKNLGGSFNDFLDEEGILEECTETAIKRGLSMANRKGNEKE